MNLLTILYQSRACPALSRREEQLALLNKSVLANRQNGITGILLHSEGVFLQVIEGTPANVDALYARISADNRHENVTLLLRQPIRERIYGDWFMELIETEETMFRERQMSQRLQALAELQALPNAAQLSTKKYVEAFLDPLVAAVL